MQETQIIFKPKTKKERTATQVRSEKLRDLVVKRAVLLKEIRDINKALNATFPLEQNAIFTMGEHKYCFVESVYLGGNHYNVRARQIIDGALQKRVENLSMDARDLEGW